MFFFQWGTHVPTLEKKQGEGVQLDVRTQEWYVVHSAMAQAKCKWT